MVFISILPINVFLIIILSVLLKFFILNNRFAIYRVNLSEGEFGFCAISIMSRQNITIENQLVLLRLPQTMLLKIRLLQLATHIRCLS
jgi:hypothetical protein